MEKQELNKKVDEVFSNFIKEMRKNGGLVSLEDKEKFCFNAQIILLLSEKLDNEEFLNLNLDLDKKLALKRRFREILFK
jgi:hypothetical protein